MVRAFILAVIAVGCTTGDKEAVDDDFTDVGDEKSDSFSQRMKLVGTLQYAQTAVVAYHNAPRYIAYKLYGREGDQVSLDVTSADGDPVTWLVNSAFDVIAYNDDSGDGLDSHIDATLPANGDGSVAYYIIVRDYALADATFTVSIAAPAHDLATWRGRSIYFVVTDRFANGDASNDNADGYPSNLGDLAAWHGGDFQGLIDRLDYIAAMGFTGIWITPVIQQHSGTAYHGYHGWDWTKVDPHLGSEAELAELVDRARDRGIAVMIDTVANHTGRYNYTSPTFPDRAMYHHNGNITDWNSTTQLENNDLNGLNDLDQGRADVRQKLLDHVRWLAATSGADGLRIDTVKHVPTPFWTDYNKTAGIFTLGEALASSVTQVAAYSHALDASIDYPLFFTLRGVFGHGQGARGLSTIFGGDSAYSDVQLNGLFVDNHDQPRFLCDAAGSDAEKLAKLRLALAFEFTARGIPMLYYGTEQGFRSCTDNRQDMFTLDPAHPLVGYVTRLNQIRAASSALRVGPQRERWRDDTVYAYEREDGASAALVVFNLSGGTRTIAMHNMHAPAGTVLTDALGSGTTATIAANLDITVTVAARSVVILTN